MKRACRSLLAVGAGCAAVVAVGATSHAADDAARKAALVELGRRIFFDPAVGRRGQVSCAACHDPEHGFSDARDRSPDEDRTLPRHSQPLVDLTGDGFHWDGEFDTVREVIDARILPGVQPATAAAERTLRRLTAARKSGATVAVDVVRTISDVLEAGGSYGSRARGGPAEEVVARAVRSDLLAPKTRVASHFDDGRYAAGFRAAFGDDESNAARIGSALEAYLGSLKSTDSAYDAFTAGDATAMSPSAQRGLVAFRGKAGCAQCHVADGTHPLFTDGAFHDTGVAVRPQAKWSDLAPRPEALGRVAATFVETDRGSFKTPSLRDVARRAPYFHDASAKTLEEVVRYYDKGGTPHRHVDPKIKPLGLADAEVSDLVAFLESLSSRTRPGLGPVDAARAQHFTVHVESVTGDPVVRRTVVVAPFGDRLAGTDAMPAPITVTTDDRGDATVSMPPSTHVVVRMDGHDVTPPLPDWTSAVSVIAPCAEGVCLRVRLLDSTTTAPDWLTARPVVEMAPNSSVAFKLVRLLGPHEALYASDVDVTIDERAWLLGAEGERTRAFDLKIAPGADNRVDLRTDDAPRDTGAEKALRRKLVEIAAFAAPSKGQGDRR